MSNDIKSINKACGVQDAFKRHPRIRQDMSFLAVPNDPNRLREALTGRAEPTAAPKDAAKFSQSDVDVAIIEFLKNNEVTKC